MWGVPVMIKTMRVSGMYRLVALALVATTSLGPVSAATPAEPVLDTESKVAIAPVTERMVALEETVADLADPVLTESYETVGEGEASYYGFELAGNRTASGERFNPHGLTAAHRSGSTHSSLFRRELCIPSSIVASRHALSCLAPHSFWRSQPR